ncbi:MAG: HAMP domain-containing histidine kinase [Clostridiales bacterium]|nr:HAMP domain-containing histidine kinase [Clostridiales bacterium]
MSKANKPKNKKPQKAINELIRAFICVLITTAFAIIPILLATLSGAIDIKLDYGYLFLLFVAVCAFFAGFTVFYKLYQNKLTDNEIIINATEKLLKGEYDLSFDELSQDYKTVGERLKEIGKLLKQTQTEKDDFINDFSHELKTPIVSIRGFAKLIKNGDLTEEEKAEYLSIIVAESNRLIDLTASTLMLDRLSNNKFEIEKTTYDLAEQIRKTVLLLQNEWEAKNLEFVADFNECKIHSNEELLSRLLLNVIQNAVKYSNDGGKIEITLKKADKHTTVAVTDHGIGMDEQTQKRMYDKYFRGDKSRSTQGNGLGLSMVKKIADLLDIELKVKSQVSKGTQFSIIFKNS